MKTRPDGPAAKSASRGSAEPSARHDLVAEAILAQAASIFAARGVQGTGIREIAEAMDMSRPAVYHYFPSKEAMLEELMAGYTGELLGFVRAVRHDEDRTPSEKIVEFVRGLALRVAARPSYLRLLVNEEGLPEKMAKAHRKARHEASEHVSAIIAEGVQTGEFRPVNERVVGFALYGMCHWIAWWFQPGGPASPDDIAEEMSLIALKGLARQGSRHETKGGVPHAIDLLREDLRYLERVAGEDGASR